MAEEGTVEPDWPWEKTHLGPPAGPRDSWAMWKEGADASLMMNFRPFIRDKFFSENATGHIAMAENRWEKMWGKREAGPFNVQCLCSTWPNPPGDSGAAPPTPSPCFDPAWLGGCQNCEKTPQPIPLPR